MCLYLITSFASRFHKRRNYLKSDMQKVLIFHHWLRTYMSRSSHSIKFRLFIYFSSLFQPCTFNTNNLHTVELHDMPIDLYFFCIERERKKKSVLLFLQNNIFILVATWCWSFSFSFGFSLYGWPHPFNWRKGWHFCKSEWLLVCVRVWVHARECAEWEKGDRKIIFEIYANQKII